jgi:hypothetical protein
MPTTYLAARLSLRSWSVRPHPGPDPQDPEGSPWVLRTPSKPGLETDPVPASRPSSPSARDGRVRLVACALVVAVTASGCGLLGPGGSDEPLADCRARTTGEIRLQRTSLLPLLRSVDRSSVTSSTTCEDTDESDPRGYLTVRAVPGATADQLLAHCETRAGRPRRTTTSTAGSTPPEPSTAPTSVCGSTRRYSSRVSSSTVEWTARNHRTTRGAAASRAPDPGLPGS